MDKSLQAESLRALEHFTVAINEEFVSQCSPGQIKWSSIQKLVNIIKQLQMKPITSEVHQRVFIDNMIMFVELVMGFLSDDKNMDHKKQIQYAVYATDFLPEILCTVEIRNNFVTYATVSLMSLFMYGRYNLASKKALITMYNTIAAKTEKKVRNSLSEAVSDIMYQLLDCLSIQGDFALQSDILETVFRIFGSEVKFNAEITHLLVPNSLELSRALAKDISVNKFDRDVRNWLEKFNKDSPNIFSIGCKKVIYGSYECQITDEDFDVMWADFNLIENMLCLCYKESEFWNRLTVPSSYVKKTKVKRPLGASESTISFLLSKPIMSSQNQKFWDGLEKHLKLIISNKEKDKINRLITQVLPQAFGDSFEHGSEKILKHPRSVYKPLAIKISKRKSDVTSASSVSKSRSEAASTIEATSPRRMPEERVSAPVSPQSAYRSDEGSVDEPKLSYANMNRDVGSDISSAVITDFTRRSRYGEPGAPLDGVVSIPSNNSDVFPSNLGSVEGPGGSEAGSDRFDVPKVQDNIVTSSHGENIDTFSEIQILSGQTIGASARQTVVQEAFEFERSEILSSSPLKISKQKELSDISSDLFLSTSEHSGEGKEQAESNQNTKVSAVQSHDDIFTEHYETAQEEFSEVEMVKVDKISQCREAPSQRELPKLRDRLANKKLSKLIDNKIGISDDTKWTSRLRSRTTKTSAEEKRLNAIEDLLSESSDDDAAQEDSTNKNRIDSKEIVKEILTETVSKDDGPEVVTNEQFDSDGTVKAIPSEASSKDVGQEVSTNEQSDSNETVKAIPSEASSKDVSQEVSTNEQSDSNETVKAIPSEAFSKDAAEEIITSEHFVHKKTEMAAVASNDALLTEDLEVIEIASQEDQQYIQGSEMSLVVNVGTEDTQSGSLQLSKTRTLDKIGVTQVKASSKRINDKIAITSEVMDKEVLMEENIDGGRGVPKIGKLQIKRSEIVVTDKEITDLLEKKSHEKPAVLKVTEKNINEKSDIQKIKATNMDNRDVVEGAEILSKEKEVDVIDLTLDEMEKSSQNGVQVAAGDAAPMFNTPDLLVILQPSVQETQYRQKTQTSVEASIVSPNEEVVPKKKKRGRTLIKTGKKRFDLKAQLSFEAEKEILDVAERKTQKTDAVEKVTGSEAPRHFDDNNREITDGVASVAVEEAVPYVIDSGTNKTVDFCDKNVIVNDSPEESDSLVSQKGEQDIVKKDTTRQKEASIADTNKTKALKKKNKGKTFTKKGKKRAVLKPKLTPEGDEDSSDVTEKKIQKKETMESVSCENNTGVDTSCIIHKNNQEITDGVACVAFEEGVPNVIDSENDILGNENVIVKDPTEEGVPVVSPKEQDMEKNDMAKGEKRVKGINKAKASITKKKVKTFTKRGKKRVVLKSVVSPEADKDSLDVTEKNIRKTDAMETDSCKKDTGVDTSHIVDEDKEEIPDGVACVAVEEGVPNGIDSGNDLLDNENVIVNDPPEESVGHKESHSQISSSQSEIFAPEINASNIDYLEKFDELKKAEDTKSNALRLSASLEKPRTIESIKAPENISAEEESDPDVGTDKVEHLKYSAVGKKGGKGKKRIANKKVQSPNEIVELDNQVTVQNRGDRSEDDNNDVLDKLETNKVAAARTPDMSPDQPSGVIVVEAQVHHEETWSERKQKSAKRSERLVRKTSTEENVSQELRQMEDSLIRECQQDSPKIIGRTRSSERIRRQSPADFDGINQAEPVAKTKSFNKSSERIKRRSPDDFDKMCQEETVAKAAKSFNKSGNLNATGGSRKLFDPNNLSYLDKMPALAEQLTPEFSDSPIAPQVKTNKLPKRGRPPKKKLEAEHENSKNKTASSKKEKKRKKGAEEKPLKKQAKNRGKRNFDFSTVDFKTLDELFNRSCAGIGCNSFAQNANRTSFGGFNASAFQPLVARAAPIDTSSDESPVALNSLLNKIVPGMKHTPDKAGSSSDFSWPEIEKENIGKTKKINILQDIVIKPKRKQVEQIKPVSAKRRKLVFDESPEVQVPVPQDDLPAVDLEIATIPQEPIVPENLAVQTDTILDAFQSDQNSALPENMECVGQEHTGWNDIEMAFKMLEELTNPVVFNALKTMVEQKTQFLEFLKSRHQ